MNYSCLDIGGSEDCWNLDISVVDTTVAGDLFEYTVTELVGILYEP